MKEPRKVFVLSNPSEDCSKLGSLDQILLMNFSTWKGDLKASLQERGQKLEDWSHQYLVYDHSHELLTSESHFEAYRFPVSCVPKALNAIAWSCFRALGIDENCKAVAKQLHAFPGRYLVQYDIERSDTPSTWNDLPRVFPWTKSDSMDGQSDNQFWTELNASPTRSCLDGVKINHPFSYHWLGEFPHQMVDEAKYAATENIMLSELKNHFLYAAKKGNGSYPVIYGGIAPCGSIVGVLHTGMQIRNKLFNPLSGREGLRRDMFRWHQGRRQL